MTSGDNWVVLSDFCGFEWRALLSTWRWHAVQCISLHWDLMRTNEQRYLKVQMVSLRENSDAQAEGQNGVNWVGRVVKCGREKKMNDAWIYLHNTQFTLWLLLPVYLPWIHGARKLFVGTRNDENEDAFGWNTKHNSGPQVHKYASRNNKFA